MTGRVRRPFLVAFLAVLLVLSFVAAMRLIRAPAGSSVLIVGASRSLRVSLAELERMPSVVREGSYQNQYGNWGGHGIYKGVLLVDLLRSVGAYHEAVVRGSDGYEARLSRERVEDAEYPVVLAYAKDGVPVPNWTEGLRLVVLPLDGGVSNEEYGATSAGSFWVMGVVQITLARSP